MQPLPAIYRRRMPGRWSDDGADTSTIFRALGVDPDISQLLEENNVT
jgi:hypothetical protein